MVINRVRALRTRFNLTQSELVERIGVTRQAIVIPEKGGYTPSLLLVMNIAEEFEVSIASLVAYYILYPDYYLK